MKTPDNLIYPRQPQIPENILVKIIPEFQNVNSNPPTDIPLNIRAPQRSYPDGEMPNRKLAHPSRRS